MSNLAIGTTTANHRIDVLNLGAKLAGSACLVGLFGLLGAYMQARSEASEWPPGDVVFDNYISLMVTLTLLMSFVTSAWARYSERKNDHRLTLVAIFLTAGLGLAAINALALLVRRLGYGPGDSSYATFSYALIIGSAAMLLAGVVATTTAGFRATARQTTGPYLDRLRAATTFWQFAVIGWLFVYASLYLYK